MESSQRLNRQLNKDERISNKQYLILAIPLIIAGISTPILGAVDTAVVGRLPNPTAIGGVAIGVLIFNTMYWLFGFLRVSTTGFTSQAIGAHDENETMLSLFRPMMIAFILGIIFILAQNIIFDLAILLLEPTNNVTRLAESYFSIRIWGAPFTLLNYVIVGWLMGLGKVQLSLIIQVVMNVMNIILDMLFVFYYGLGVSGVAYATLISEVFAFLLGGWFIFQGNKAILKKIKPTSVISTSQFKVMFIVNRDLFLRTACLLMMTCTFTAVGSRLGEVTLACNAILLQLHYILAYFFGGFSNASSILIGKAIGANNKSQFKQAIRLSAKWGFLTAICLSMLVYLFGDFIVSIFTSINEVKEMALQYLGWIVIFPLVGFWGLHLEGIFSGATEAKDIRNTIGIALLIFLIIIWVALPVYYNNGLWFAFIMFCFARSFFLSLCLPSLERRVFN